MSIKELIGTVPKSHDPVNFPSHYQSKNGLEVIDAIEAFTDELVGYEAVFTAQVLKYICRWRKKNGVEDLKKAKWYLDRLIRKVELDESKKDKGDMTNE